MSDPVGSSRPRNRECLPEPLCETDSQSCPSALPARSPTGSDTSVQHGSDKSKARDPGLLPRAEALVFSDHVEVSFAAIEGRDAGTGIEAELFAATVKVGLQNEAEANMVRFGVSSDNGVQRVDGTFLQAQASAGIHNADGSEGANIGASAQLAGVEGTVGSGGNSATLGVSAGIGASASFGLRDKDHDGATELCGRISGTLGFGLSAGLCIENPLSWF